ncbi:mycothiol conjugate amidase Mca [Corynebacterium aquilae]|uniref:Mycothiol S-conjugate amidase n=1 Tax=Corynebacterium aquilae DSM 44791 TaxID=1431546 RepID=A0A1L7CF81_9CORY|nr:mycothiol conjugate amidase Mca [Corynebacterium aquilae]APT84433.1 GlcNAc-PI de-N-acetylase [Corynebacterium aquilae DSM 44791]
MSTSNLRIMAIHAHPDDESSKGAATMARYVAEGADVLVVTCTGGERGDVLNPGLNAEEIDDIAALRKQEMANAARALGISHRWLGYVDSGLPQGDPLPPLPEGCFALADSDEVTEKLVGIIREFRPQVIITYDENGGYPHPDHLKVHEVSMLAWERAGDADFYPEAGEPFSPLKLYYTHGFIRQRLEIFHEEFIKQGLESPYAEFLQRWKTNRADIMARVTTQIECADYFEARDEALRAHATQIDPAGTFFATDLETQRRLWPTEEFELAQTRVTTSIPEDDLFAGIEA